MERIEKYWVDKNNNRWSADNHSEREAITLSATLIRCTNCINCSNCIECKDCIDCILCINCNTCTELNNCYDCSKCAYSTNLIRCFQTLNSENCRDCRNCTKCTNIANKEQMFNLLKTEDNIVIYEARNRNKIDNLYTSVYDYCFFITDNFDDHNDLFSYLIANISDKEFQKQTIKEFREMPEFPFFDSYTKKLNKLANNVVNSINDLYNENYTIKTIKKGMIFEDTLTFEQYVSLLDNLNFNDLDNIYVYSINDVDSFLTEKKAGVIVDFNEEKNVVEIPINISDPLQLQFLEEQLTSFNLQSEQENEYNLEI